MALDQITPLEARRTVLERTATLVLDAAEREARALTEEDKRELAVLEKEIGSLTARMGKLATDEAMIAEIARITGGPAAAADARRGGRGSFAQQVAQAAFGKFLADHRGRLSKAGPAWTSPPLDLVGFGSGELRAITDDPASGGALLLPEVETEIQPLPTRPLVVADLMGGGTTAANSITFMKEKTITDAADTVAAGALKPQSDIAFEAANEPVKKIATWLEIVEELLEDVAGLSGYLSQRLRHFVQLEEDDQLLNGDGLGTNFTGILHRAGLAAPIARGATENNADVLLRQASAIELATSEAVSAFVLHPANWDALLLLKNANDDYIASGGPFGTPQRKLLWGREVAVTPAQAIGTGTVGAFKTASAFRRRTPIRVVASNSHADFFIRNKIALVAEERGALVVYRESAFGLVTNLTAAGA